MITDISVRPTIVMKVHNKININTSYLVVLGHVIIGASLSEPHIDELNVRNLLLLSLLLLLY